MLTAARTGSRTVVCFRGTVAELRRWLAASRGLRAHPALAAALGRN